MGRGEPGEGRGFGLRGRGANKRSEKKIWPDISLGGKQICLDACFCKTRKRRESSRQRKIDDDDKKGDKRISKGTFADNAQDKYVGNGEWGCVCDEGGATGRQQISLSTNANVGARFCERCLLPMIRSMLTRFLEPD